MRLLSKSDSPHLALILTMALFGVASSLPLESMWGINHLQFLPSAWWYFYWLVFAAVISLTFIRAFDDRLDQLVESVSRVIFDHGVWPKLAITAVAMLVFWLFRMQTHFLGDGYTMLSVFGQGERYLQKWTETGTIGAIRLIQGMLGDHSRTTAETAFQILSIGSGGICVFNFIEIARRVSPGGAARLLSLVTLLLSGTVLLFFGYVELYPLVWAGATTFLNAAIRYAEEKKGIWLVLVSFAVTAWLHLLALSFAVGILYLVLRGLLREDSLSRFSTTRVVMLSTLLVVVGLLSIRLVAGEDAFKNVLLPVFTGQQGSPDYTLFSAKHALDVINEALLMLPCALAFATFLASRQHAVNNDSEKLLLAMSVGSLSFLALVDPGLGMGRDWDLMSASLFPPTVFVLSRLSRADLNRWGSFIVSSCAVTVLIGSAYLCTNLSVLPSENRFLSLVEYYGAKDRSGWSSLAAYFRDKQDIENLNRVLSKMNTFFPGEALLAEAYSSMDKGDFRHARALGERLVQLEPINTRYLQLLGKAYSKTGEFSRGEECYLRALELKPGSIMLRNELGHLYLQQGRYDQALRVLRVAHRMDPSLSYIAEGIGLAYLRLGFPDSASAVADGLLASDSHSPGGCVLKMMVAIGANDLPTARQYFAIFRNYGTARSDYRDLVEYYRYLHK